MSKALSVHPAERVDLEDFEHATKTFPAGEISLANQQLLLDRQCRIVKGFRVEIPDQTVYPGRVIVHAWYGLDTSGRRLFNEDQLSVSRTTTLLGAATHYLEVEFVEVLA